MFAVSGLVLERLLPIRDADIGLSLVMPPSELCSLSHTGTFYHNGTISLDAAFPPPGVVCCYCKETLMGSTAIHK